MRVIIETEVKFKKMLEEIAAALNAKIAFEDSETDFWDSLPTNIQEGILEAKNQVENGEFKVHEEVMDFYKKKYK